MHNYFSKMLLLGYIAIISSVTSFGAFRFGSVTNSTTGAYIETTLPLGDGGDILTQKTVADNITPSDIGAAPETIPYTYTNIETKVSIVTNTVTLTFTTNDVWVCDWNSYPLHFTTVTKPYVDIYRYWWGDLFFMDYMLLGEEDDESYGAFDGFGMVIGGVTNSVRPVDYHEDAIHVKMGDFEFTRYGAAPTYSIITNHVTNIVSSSVGVLRDSARILSQSESFSNAVFDVGAAPKTIIRPLHEPYLPDEFFPITYIDSYLGETTIISSATIRVQSNDSSFDRLVYYIYPDDVVIWFNYPTGTYTSFDSESVLFNGKPGISGVWPKLQFGGEISESVVYDSPTNTILRSTISVFNGVDGESYTNVSVYANGKVLMKQEIQDWSKTPPEWRSGETGTYITLYGTHLELLQGSQGRMQWNGWKFYNPIDRVTYNIPADADVLYGTNITFALREDLDQLSNSLKGQVFDFSTSEVGLYEAILNYLKSFGATITNAPSGYSLTNGVWRHTGTTP